MEGKQQGYLNVWGDTVDFKELLTGVFLGAALGYSSYIAGLWYLKSFHPGIEKGLLQGYALIFGVCGCLVIGVIAAKVFKAKRIFIEDDYGIDKNSALLELNLNLQQEAEYLKGVAPDVIEEMHKLGIYQLFTDEARNKEEGK